MANLRFKLWLNEVVELSRPKGARKSKFVKDPGTNVAKEGLQWAWTTSKGNKIKLHFIPKWGNSYEVMFYVNGSLLEDGENEAKEDKYGNRKPGNQRDPEILSSIMYMVKDKVDKLNAKEFSFSAYGADKDNKIIKNLDLNKNIPEILDELNKFQKIIMNHKVEMIPPTQNKIDLWKRLNRGMPASVPSLNSEAWLRWIQEVKSNLKEKVQTPYQVPAIETLKDNLLAAEGTNRFQYINYDPSYLVSLLKLQALAIRSNTEDGATIKNNRRAAIYERLFKRYFPDWEMDKYGDSFTFKREL